MSRFAANYAEAALSVCRYSAVVARRGRRVACRRVVFSFILSSILPSFFAPSLDCVCCPAWAAGRLPGVGHGVRGAAAPLHPLHPRTPLFAGAWKESLKLDSTPPAACRVGVGADLPGRFGRVMSAPAAALRPPSGRTGSPSRPRHRCNSDKRRRAEPCRKAVAVENRRRELCRAAGRYEVRRGRLALGKRMCRRAGQRLVRQRKGSRRAGVFLFLLMRAFRRSRKARCFLKGSARPLCRGTVDGGKRRRCRGVTSSRKKRVGGRGGGLGEGEHPCALAKGVPLPSKKLSRLAG